MNRTTEATGITQPGHIRRLRQIRALVALSAVAILGSGVAGAMLPSAAAAPHVIHAHTALQTRAPAPRSVWN